MTKQMIPNTGRDLIVSMNYDPTGLAWVELFDNQPLGWAVDDADIKNPEPVVVGSLPPAPPATAPILSPQWAQFSGGYMIVPDVVRMLPDEFFSWLGTNNGATREVRSSMKSNELGGAFHSWGGGAPGTPGASGLEAPLVEGSFAPGRRGPDQPYRPAGRTGVNGERDFDRARDAERRPGEAHPGGGDPSQLPATGHPGEPGAFRPGELRPGEHPSGGPVDPMRSSDLGDTGRRGSEGEHHRESEHRATKPSEPKSPPHPSQGRDEHSSR